MPPHRLARLLLPALLALVLARTAGAHDDLDLQVEALSARIAAAPDATGLLLERADLHRLREDWSAASCDIERVEALDPGRVELDLARARMEHDRGQDQRALAHVDRYLLSRPQDERAWLLRAQAEEALGVHAASALDYTRALTLQQPPSPDVYAARARVTAAQGPEHLVEAIAGLDEGLAQLGPVVALQLQAIALERERHAWDAALARLQGVAAGSQRQEAWLLQRGEILLCAGRPDAAREAFVAARAAVASLSHKRRSTRAVAELSARIEQRLAQLAPPQQDPTPCSHDYASSRP